MSCHPPTSAGKRRTLLANFSVFLDPGCDGLISRLWLVDVLPSLPCHGGLLNRGQRPERQEWHVDLPKAERTSRPRQAGVLGSSCSLPHTLSVWAAWCDWSMYPFPCLPGECLPNQHQSQIGHTTLPNPKRSKPSALSSTPRITGNALLQIDKVERQLEGKAQSLAGNLEKLHSFEKTFWVSAAKGYGVPDLREYLLSKWVPSRPGTVLLASPNGLSSSQWSCSGVCCTLGCEVPLKVTTIPSGRCCSTDVPSIVT